MNRPLKPGERIQMRLSGEKPVVVGDAETLTFVIDPSNRVGSSNSAAKVASLAIRRGGVRMAAIGNVPLGGEAVAGHLGTVLDIGDVEPGPAGSILTTAAYLSLRTAGTDASPDGALTMVERMRFGPGNCVSTPVGSELDVRGGATMRNDLTVYGDLYATKYLNLVDDHTSASIFLPPTANALREAYQSLSNLVTETLSGTLGGGGGGGGAQGVGSSAGSNALVVSDVSCHGMWVAGSLRAASYCNLAHDYTCVDRHRPPSAAALNAAYAQLSNHLALQLELVRPLHAASSGVSSNGGGVPVARRLQDDLWLDTVGDGLGRLRFDRDGPTHFGAAPSSDPAFDAFRWETSRTALQPSMTLSHTGALALHGDDATLQVGAAFSVRPGLLGATIAADLQVGRDLRVGGALVVAEGGYRNLPIATADVSGVTRLSSSPSTLPAASNVAASVALVSAIGSTANDRAATIEGLLGQTCYAAETATERVGRLADALQEQGRRLDALDTLHPDAPPEPPASPTFTRVYADADAEVKTGVSLTNVSDADGSGVQIRMACGSDHLERPAATLAMRGGKERTLQIRGPDGFSTIELGGTLGGVEVRSSWTASDRPGPAANGGGRPIPAALNPSSSNAVTIRDAVSGHGTWRDLDAGVDYTSSASSIFQTTSLSFPHHAFETAETLSSWMSDRERYSLINGYPTEFAAETTVASASQAASTLDVRGEWLQLDLSTGVFATHVRIAMNNLNHVPDDFVLLGRGDPADPVWHYIAETQQQINQAEALVNAGVHDGRLYALSTVWSQRPIRSLRIVVTRVMSINDVGYFSTMVQIGRVSFEGADFVAPTVPDRLLRIGDGAGGVAMVDRRGNVGVGLSRLEFPGARLHVRGGGAGLRKLPLLTMLTREAGPTHAFDTEDDDGTWVQRAGGGALAIRVAGSDGDAVRVERDGMRVTGSVTATDLVQAANSVVLRSPADTRMEVRRTVPESTHSLLDGVLLFRMFEAFDSSDPAGLLRDGYAQDLRSLASGTAGLFGLSSGGAARGPGEGRDLLRAPIAIEWSGMVEARETGRYEFEVISDMPASVSIGPSNFVHYGDRLRAQHGAELPAPDVLDPRWDDPGAGVVSLPDAQTAVLVDLDDRFLDDVPRWIDRSVRSLTYEVVADPAALVAGRTSSGVLRLLGTYSGASTMVRVRATSAASGRSVEADVLVRDAAPTAPIVLSPLGTNGSLSFSPFDAPVMEFDLSVHFADTLRPAYGLVYSIPATPGGSQRAAELIGGRVLRVTSDTRGRAHPYAVAVTAESAAFPSARSTLTLSVSEPWPVEAGLFSPPLEVTLADHFTETEIDLDLESGGRPFFMDLRRAGIVLSIECDVPGAAVLARDVASGIAAIEAATWERFAAFSGAAPRVLTRRPPNAHPSVPPKSRADTEADHSPAFPDQSDYFRPPDSGPTSLVLLGDYRDSSYQVTLVATSVDAVWASTRAVLTVHEPPAPPPILSPHGSALRPPIRLKNDAEERSDLTRAFIDVAGRGMVFMIRENPFGNAELLPDGTTLRVVHAGGTAIGVYRIVVDAISMPYGVRTEAPLTLSFCDSDPPPVPTSGGIFVVVHAAPGDIRIPLEPLFNAFGPLLFTASATVYDSVYIDSQTDQLVITDIVTDVQLSYDVTVRATDADGQFAEIIVHVTEA